MISKLNNVVMPMYESYRSRRVPVSMVAGTAPKLAAQYRLDALRDIMRMEMPDRWSDVTSAPITLVHPGQAYNAATNPYIARPSVNQAYCNAIGYNTTTNSYSGATPSNTNQNAETLYLIVRYGITDGLGGRDLFSQNSVGDADQDGFNEFIDGWGTPIRFLRWAPGFASELGREAAAAVASGSGTALTATGGLSTSNTAYNNCAILFTSGALAGQAYSISGYTGSSQTFQLSPALAASPAAGDTFNVMDPDPFDPQQIYGGGNPATYVLYPLIYSAGANKVTGIVSDTPTPPGPTAYATLNNNPFFGGNGTPFGTQQDLTGEQSLSGWETKGWLDNIHNHLIGTR